MCGILFTLSSSSAPPSPSHISLISLRGPDSTRTHTIISGCNTLTFTSSLLSVRGSQPTPQPLVDPSTGSVLCWNGEAWRISGVPIASCANDTCEIFKVLLSAPEGRVKDVLSTIEGEFAFVFYDAPTRMCWFGRDWAGRRSLVKRRRGSAFEVASVGDGVGEEPWEEVEAGGVWRVDVGSGEEAWITKRTNGDEIHSVPNLNMELPTEGEHPMLTVNSPEVTSFHYTLLESLRLRVRDIQLPPDSDLRTRPRTAIGGDDVRLAILFSGGVDCTTIARIAHEVLPPEEPVDLLNVAFENPRIVAARSNQPLPKTNGKLKGKKKAELNIQQSDSDPPLSTSEPASDTDLDPYSLCPDRTTGLSSFNELRKTCPTRPWRFVSINIPYTEVLAHRSTVISLMHPHDTEMDLSIALAFYFASRGQGSTDHGNYSTPARILLSGLGADELLGGYTRHSTAFRRAGYQGLLDELNLDFQRLGKRNLGRDDRVAAHWAKELRYPFLDEKVVAWAMTTPAHRKCPFGSSSDSGKKILRLLAQKLGMANAAGEAKRAVQFGARSAKMSLESRKMKGTDGLKP
ncbi:asparagine synthase-domain-containing protein [Trichophaea hybrida]|nr:asparagine synthase-domain-containing protein [Trichophaea hybrida]